jgi:hypothetical protein
MARLITSAGALAACSGVLGWLTARSQLARERIVVPASARWLSGRTVNGPLTALAEAEAIRKTTLHVTGGRTYSELEEDDPTARIAMNASLLRSSLLTSVLAFGLAATEIGLGGVLMTIGAALTRLQRSGSPGNRG